MKTRGFDRTSGIYSPVVREHEISAEKQYIEMKSSKDGEIEEATRRIVAGDAAAADMERRALRAETDAKSRAVRLHALQTEHDKLSASMTEQADRHRQLDAEAQARLVVLQNEISLQSERFREQEAALQSEVASREERLAVLQGDNARLEASLAEIAEQHRTTESDQAARFRLMESERDRLSASLSERFQELATFANRMEVQRKERGEINSRLQIERDELRGAKQDLERAQRTLEQVQADRDRLSKKIEEASARAVQAQAGFNASRDASQRQIGALSSELYAVNRKLDDVLHSNTWKIGRPFRVLRRLLTRSRAKPVVRVEDIARIRASGVFDEDWYLVTYPDVAALKMDPVHHYLAHGCGEGRDPSPAFSTRAFYDAHPKLIRSEQNALVYFLDHGD